MADGTLGCWISMDFHPLKSNPEIQKSNGHRQPGEKEIPPFAAGGFFRDPAVSAAEATGQSKTIPSCPWMNLRVALGTHNCLEIFLPLPNRWSQLTTSTPASAAEKTARLHLTSRQLGYTWCQEPQSQANQRESEHNDFDFALPC